MLAYFSVWGSFLLLGRVCLVRREEEKEGGDAEEEQQVIGSSWRLQGEYLKETSRKQEDWKIW